MRPSGRTLGSVAAVLVVVVIAVLSALLAGGEGGNGTVADSPSAAASSRAGASASGTASPDHGVPTPSFGDQDHEPGAKPTGPGYGRGPDDPSTRHGDDPASGLPWVDVDDLPAEAQQTLRLIDAGGPFPYPGKDGSTFRNAEGLLPEEPSGYYAEYTVPTPGESDRGARRIVTGDGGEYYWTPDHYESFDRIDR